MNFTFTEAKRFRADSSGGEEEEEESCDEEMAGYSNGVIKLPRPGKKTRGRVKVRMEFIKNKLRRYTTFSKRKTGIMKKAYELATLTGTQVMVLVASETGHVYTFATQKLQPMITSEAGKALIQTCLNSPDPGTSSNTNLRMTETGYEEQDLTYNVPEDREEEEEGEGEEEFVSETKPQICETRESSPGTSLPGLEQCSSSSPPLMTIPPHVLTQLLTSALPPPRPPPTITTRIPLMESPPAPSTALVSASSPPESVNLQEALAHLKQPPTVPGRERHKM